MRQSKSLVTAILLGGLGFVFSPVVNAQADPREASRSEYAKQIRQAFKGKDEAEIARLVGSATLSIVDMSPDGGPTLFLSPVEFAGLVSSCEESEAIIGYPADAKLAWACPSQSVDEAGCYFPSFHLEVSRHGEQILTVASRYSRIKAGVTNERCPRSAPPRIPPVYVPVDAPKAQ